jgi:hypothetical protein
MALLLQGKCHIQNSAVHGMVLNPAAYPEKETGLPTNLTKRPDPDAII